MANVQLLSSTEMLNDEPWHGQVTSAGASHFTAGAPAFAARTRWTAFEDVSVALDLDGNAGTVARILGATFGKHAVASTELTGIGLRLADTGTSAEALMQLALNNRLGQWHTTDDVVNLLYTNVVGSSPPSQQAAVYRGWLDSGLYTEASLGMYAARTGENEANIGLAGLAQTGLAFV